MITTPKLKWQLRENSDIRTDSTKSLVYWGFANCMFTFVLLLLLALGQHVAIAELTKYHLLNIGVWLMVTFSTRRLPLRVPAAVIILLILQVWFAVCTLLAEVQVVRPYPIVLTYYHVLSIVLCFLQASVLVYLDERTRNWFANACIVIAGASSFVAIGQLFGIGAFIAIGNNVMAFAELSSFATEGDSTIRAIGFLPFGHGTTLCLITALLIAGRLTKRNLNALELVLIPTLLIGAVAPQVRILLPGVFVTIGIIGYYLFKRYRSTAVPISIFSIMGLVLVGYFARNRLGYLLKGGGGFSQTFDYRQDSLWTQAFRVLQDRPWTGIGVEPAYVGMPSAKDIYVGPGIMDGMFHSYLAFGGIPAFTLQIVFLTFAIFGLGRELLNKTIDSERKIVLVAIVPMFVNMPAHMYVGNYYLNAGNAFMLACAAGFAMISEKEYMAYVKTNLRSRYGSPRRFDRIAATYVGTQKPETTDPALNA
jgi:hypothetical protein